jgi:hypothetical protein
MTQEQKDLLLKDLCARLPYGVKGLVTFNGNPFMTQIHVEDRTIDGKLYDRFAEFQDSWYDNVTIKPYLFPLSSMTEEQKYDFYCRFIENDCDFDDFKEFYLDNGMWHKLLTSLDDIEAIIDWFHKNHFDYRGLIPMDLANDATDKNIY